jgi:alcohol dehydrogenase class IV
VDGIYVFGSPSSVLYGTGCLDKVGERVARFGAKRALIVTDESAVTTGKVARLQSILAASKLSSETYAGVNTEPTVSHVEEGLAVLRQSGCDLVIGFGGGSPMDTAKAIAVLATNPGTFADYHGQFVDIPQPRLPLVAITTTAGTGSEVTKASVVADPRRNVKMVMRGERVRPDLAVCDPLLTISLPPGVTAATGMDALAHAIEGSVSTEAQPLSEVFALEAVKLIGRSLPIACANGNDLAARSDMMLGQLLAGFAFGISATCTGHGLARPLGAHFHIPHGLCNALCLPVFMDFTLPACPHMFARMAVAMGEDTAGLTVWDAARKAVDAVRRITRLINIPTLKELNIDLDEYRRLIPVMAKDGLDANSHQVNLRVPTMAQLERMYESLIDQ